MKFIVFTICFNLSLFAISFNEYKSLALKNSFDLKKSQLNIEKNVLKKYKNLRRLNPEFEANFARYERDNGFETSIKIQYRLDGFIDDLKRVYEKNILVSKQKKCVAKERFLKKLETLYTNYIYQTKKILNIEKEIEINKNLLKIAREKFNKGFGKKIDIYKLQTKLLELKNNLFEQKNISNKALYELYKFTSLQKELDQNSFLYGFDDFKLKNINISYLKLLETKKHFFLSKAKINRHNIRKIDFVIGYEKEPEQDILRAGINFELPIYTKKEEEKISLIKAKEAQEKKDFLIKKLSIYKNELQKKYLLLKNKANILKKSQDKLNQLLTLYIESYKIDKSSLIELYDVKNELIKVKNELLKNLYELNVLVIEANYLKGRYND